MTPPVWVLSVDLQAKTATFQSGLSDAAKSARGAFGDIKSGSSEMGREVGGNMMEARHGVMLLGEEFGIHLPRALTTFIASIGPIGAAMEAAFPFLAIAVGATLLLEHLVKLKEAGMELTNEQLKFATSIQTAFNQLDEKILQAGIRADELRKDHLGALQKQLQLIDMQSMDELEHAFDDVAKHADVVLARLTSSWYQFGIGSAGAKHALETFQSQYESLLAQGKSDEASGLLSGTLAQAQKVLALQKEAASSKPHESWTGGKDYEATTKYNTLINSLKQFGVGITEKEVQSQQALVDALQEQEGIQSRIATLNKMEKSNDKTAAGQADQKDVFKRFRADFEAGKEAGRDAAKAFDEIYKQSIDTIVQGEKEKIEATKEGSAARLAAINAALQDEVAMGLRGTESYRSLLNDRITLIRRMSEEQAKLQEEAGREAAENEEKMGAIQLSALKEYFAERDSSLRANAQREAAEQTTLANIEYQLKMSAMQRELAALDKNAADYENKLRSIQDKEKQLTQQHEQQITTIREQAEIERNRRILAAEDRFQSDIARGLTSVLMGHQTFTKMMLSLGDQVVSGMIQNAIKSMLAEDMTKEKDAAAAARKAFNLGLSMGGPAGVILGPVMGAAAFASVMAFEAGGIVPGVGRGDIVPAMLSPGEAVLPKGMTEMLNRASQSGGSGPTNVTHVHVRPTYHVNTIDGNGMRDALEKHTDVLQRHFNNAVRRMNK